VKVVKEGKEKIKQNKEKYINKITNKVQQMSPEILNVLNWKKK
jgi:hypothetical protein